MRYEENIFLIFNTSAFLFREGKDMYLYFLLDNFPTLICLPFLIFAFKNYFKRRELEKQSNRLSHIK